MLTLLRSKRPTPIRPAAYEPVIGSAEYWRWQCADERAAAHKNLKDAMFWRWVALVAIWAFMLTAVMAAIEYALLFGK